MVDPATLPPAVRDGAVALPNVPHVVTLGGARVVLWDTAKRRAERLASDHIDALVSLLVHGADRQREDVAAILANAACDKGNRRDIALAGAIPLLVRGVTQADRSQHTFVGKLTRALANLAWKHSDNQLQIEASGGVDALVALLANDSDLEIQDEAATALSHLMDNHEVVQRVQTANAYAALEKMAHDGPEPQRTQAAWLLAKIKFQVLTPDDVVADIPALVQLLTNSSRSDHAQRAVAVLRQLSHDAKHKSDIVVAGGLAPLIELLKTGVEKQRVDAAWTLGHLAWNAFSEAQIGHAGAIPPLIELLHSSSVREREGAVWALRHLSSTSDNRNRLGSSSKGISALLTCVRSAGSSCEREHAIATLKNLSCSSENQTAIGAAGAIPILVTVIAKGSPVEVTEAVATLRNLVRQHSSNQLQLASTGGIRLLVDVLASGTNIQQVHAAATLANVASDTNLQNEIVTNGALPVVLTLTESKHTAVLEQVTQLVRNLVWCNEPIQARIGASGVIPRVTAMLYSDNDILTKQAAAVLRNLAWQHAPNQARIEEAHAVPALLKLVATGTAGQREQAAAAIANLMWNNPIAQESVAQANGLNPLVELMSRGNEKLQKQGTLAIRHFVFNGSKKVQVAARGVIPSFVQLLAAGPTPTHQQHATWVLANLACNPDNKMEIVSTGGIPSLVGALSTGSMSQRQYAASALANLACNHDHKVRIIDAKGVGPLVKLVADGSDGQKKQAAWALRNLAWSCTEGQIAIADANGTQPLVTLVETGTDSQKEHAAAALANLACQEENQNKIVGAGGISALVQLANRGSEGQKQQAAWAIANIAMSPNHRMAIIEADGLVALQRLLVSGTPDQQRGASAALARINNPGNHNFVTNESHAVFRSPSNESEESDRPFRELLRVASVRANAVNESQTSPQEIKIGRALYRSIGSIPEIITSNPPGLNDGFSQSPARRLSKSSSFAGMRRTPERRPSIVPQLPSVQESGETSSRVIESSVWTMDDHDLLNPPDALPLRKARSANVPTRVAVRMPSSPVEPPTRANRPMLPRPSTLGDLLDPHGGYSPPKESVLRRNLARIQSDMDMIRKSSSTTPWRDQSMRRSPSAVEFRGGRLVRPSEERGSNGSHGSYEDKTQAPRMGSQGSGVPLVPQQKHRNSAGSDEHSRMPLIEQSHSGNEEVYEFDETVDIAFPVPPPLETESKYPIISL